MACGAHFLAFCVTFVALVLLVLITFSVPFISNFYFLQASISGGTTFGIWGWCLDNGTNCTPKAVGYTFDPEIIFWLTQTLVLFPISAGFTLLSLLSLIPTICTSYYERYYPSPLFAFFIFLSWLSSLVALAFMFALFGIAMQRFDSDGFTSSFGPLAWLSIAATVVLTVLILSSGCGGMFGFRRSHRDLVYAV